MSSSRPTWDEVWLHTAGAVAGRSLCSRAQVGAVIVDSSNRVVSTGYNGPPAGFDHGDDPCYTWCPRGMGVTSLDRDYSDCPALHAEANALMAADRSTWAGGTMYVLGDICYSCAKLIANSGLAGVVIQPDGKPRSYRDPETSYAFLERCGIEVVVRAVEDSATG